VTAGRRYPIAHVTTEQKEVTHVPQANPEAARLAEALRAAMKDQALSGAALADAIERLTGDRPHPMWVSRRLSGERPLISVSPDLVTIARALGLSPLVLAMNAITPELVDKVEH
jgi:hypothetical protein